MRKTPLLSFAGLAACVTSAAPPASGGTCRNDHLSQFVGQPASQALGAEIQRVSGARVLQWVAHGMMVTMEFNPERLRVFLTADNRVERASCG